MDVFEMHTAEKCVFLVCRADRAYLCTRLATKSVFEYLVWLFGMHNAKKSVFGGARQMHIPLHQKCNQECLCVPSTGVPEVHYAKKCVFLLGHAERT